MYHILKKQQLANHKYIYHWLINIGTKTATLSKLKFYKRKPNIKIDNINAISLISTVTDCITNIWSILGPDLTKTWPDWAIGIQVSLANPHWLTCYLKQMWTMSMIRSQCWSDTIWTATIRAELTGIQVRNSDIEASMLVRSGCRGLPIGAASVDRLTAVWDMSIVTQRCLGGWHVGRDMFMYRGMDNWIGEGWSGMLSVMMGQVQSASRQVGNMRTGNMKIS